MRGQMLYLDRVVLSESTHADAVTALTEFLNQFALLLANGFLPYTT
jgi:hypothetical protein